MSRFSEVSSLFATLASHLRPQDPTPRHEVDLTISNLNRSLNLSELPRVRILDTALSLMCFTAPQVYDSVIEYTLRTIVAVLSSSIECKVLRINQEHVLRVGGLISKSDCASVMEGCADILGKMGAHKGHLCDLLLYSVFRMAAFAPCLPHAIPSNSNEMKLDDSETTAFANLVGHLPKESTFRNGEIPLRLLLWHLDPMILKQDVSQILQEIIRRPFLSLRMEIYGRMDWRSKIVCLAMSPTMFIEIRALLHKWFLMTGLAPVMELQTEIVGQVLDIISRPMCWGMPADVGSKLPFSHAYFPYEHHLLRILAGPISLEYFQELLQKISNSVSHVGDHLHSSSRKTAKKINVVDHQFMWAIAINFPGWFLFASMMLFSNNEPADNFYSGSSPRCVKHCIIHDQEVTCSVAAAKFIAWILNPINDSNQLIATDYLVKVSDLWNEVTRAHRETRRPKLHDKDGILKNELDSCSVSIWLKKFKNLYSKHLGTPVSSSASNTKEFGIHQNQLLRRIPLGIFLLCPDCLNGSACSMLLHYSATGIIPEFPCIQNPEKIQKRQEYGSCGDSEMWSKQYIKVEAVAGCKAVFDITDIAENVCSSLLESEEEEMNFVCQVKLKCFDYLLKCIKRLLQIKESQEDLQMHRDLLTRVIKWRHQGKDVFQNNEHLDYVCDALHV